MWSRVLLLWLMLFVGSLAIGGVALWLGNFVQSNIRTELASQQIAFGALENLSEEELALPGVRENAGLPVTTGNQAQAYAGLIGLHLAEGAEEAGYPGASYASLGGIQRQLRAEVAAATEAGDEAAIEAAQAELTTVTNLRNTALTGSTLRGTLLSAYGWDNVAMGVLAAGGIMVALSLVFLVLYFYELRRGHLPPTEA
jgi:hypothetical protein